MQKSQCRVLAHRITKRLTLWTNKFLSYGGRLQLLKSVIEGMVSFWAQIFVLPKKVVKFIEAKCRSFLWAGTALDSKKVPIAWNLVCQPVQYGGLG